MRICRNVRDSPLILCTGLCGSGGCLRPATTCWCRLRTGSQLAAVWAASQLVPIPATSRRAALRATSGLVPLWATSRRLLKLVDALGRETGKTLRVSQIAAVVSKACFFALICAAVGGCSTVTYAPKTAVRTGTVRPSTVKQMETLNMDRAAPILIRIYKEESTLEVWKQDRGGRFALLSSYPICKFSGNLGPKLMQGDHQAPEGFYDIAPDQMNPNSSEYLAFNTGFPNALDRSLGRTGSFLMVHGGCRSAGCYAMTDYAMEEIYGLVEEAFKGGQEKVQLQAFPFRMTAQNLASHAGDPNMPFWEMLKAGSDAFLATERPPRVAVCDRRYVFNPAIADDLNPSAPCPIGIDSTPIAGALQPSRGMSATANTVPPNTRTVAYRTADPIAEEIKRSLRGIY